MIIIYHCFGGSHSSVLAAALHLRLIDKCRIPTTDELMAIPYFDKTCDEDFGSIRFMGIDDSGHEVYVLGKKSMGGRYSKILRGVASILGKEDQVLPVDCTNRINLFMKIGGFSSRRMGLISPGRPIVLKGTRNAFLDMVNLVETVRIKTMKRGAEVKIL